MRLSKGGHIGRLKTPLYQLFEVSVRVKGIWMELQIVRPYDVEKMLRESRAIGIPEYAAMDAGQYLFTVYPIPDRRYDCQVVGSVVLRQ